MSVENNFIIWKLQCYSLLFNDISIREFYADVTKPNSPQEIEKSH